MPPKLFIGSSREALPAAGDVKKLLSAHTQVTVWQDAFLPGQMLLTNLVGLVTKFDFGLFLITPDDLLKIRKEQAWAVRDNVLFEVGIFMGGLGIERTFLVVVGGVRTPSDLAGLLVTNIPARGRRGNVAPGRVEAALAPIVRAIKELRAAPRNAYDELLSLAGELDQRELTIGRRKYVLGDLLRRAASARRRPWYPVSDPKELLDSLRRFVSETVVDTVYWWLVVLGVLRFKGIEAFTSEDGWSWRNSVDYVMISDRGARLLNQLRGDES